MCKKKDAKRAKIKEIDEVIAMFEQHEKGIIIAIVTGANNARAKPLNGIVQELKTIRRGYKMSRKL